MAAIDELFEPTTMQEEQDAEFVAREVKKALAPKRGKLSAKYRVLLIIVSLAMMALLRTGFIFTIIGLLPSIVAYYTDVTTERYSFKTILACNICGLLPSMEVMLRHGPSSSVLQAVMGNATNWVIIYGSALIGWLIVQICPMIAQVMIGSLHHTQISRITHLQKKIENEWGPEVVQFEKDPEEDAA